MSPVIKYSRCFHDAVIAMDYIERESRAKHHDRRVHIIKHTSKEAFRKALHKRREEISGSLTASMKKFMSGENRQTIAAGQDEGDLSVVHQAEYMSCSQLAAKTEGIRKIDRALKRLYEGEYGICEECKQAISIKRLKAIPFALLCRDCQEEKEQRLREMT
jgi:DnaK suppressor protein